MFLSNYRAYGDKKAASDEEDDISTSRYFSGPYATTFRPAYNSIAAAASGPRRSGPRPPNPFLS